MSTIESPMPRFAQIAEVLRDRIAREIYQAGEPFRANPSWPGSLMFPASRSIGQWVCFVAMGSFASDGDWEAS